MPEHSDYLEVQRLREKMAAMHDELMFLSSHVATYGKDPYRLSAMEKCRDASAAMGEAARALASAETDISAATEL